MTALSDQLAEATAEGMAVRSASEEISERLRMATARENSFEEILTGYNKEIDRLRIELEDEGGIKKRKIDSPDEIETLKDRIVELEREQEKELPESEISRRLKTSRERFDQERQYSARLKVKNQQLKDSRAFFDEKNFQAHILRLSELLKQKDDLNHRLLSQHIALQQSLGLKDLAETLENREKNFEQSSHLIQEEISRLRKQLSDANERTVSVHFELTRLTKERDQLRAELSDSVSSVDTLTNALKKTRDAMTKLSSDHSQISEKTSARKSLGPDLIKLELEEYRKKVKCSLCGARDKEVALTRCMHCFCKTCVDENLLQARNRKCPLCGLKFADSDVRPVHLLGH